jgi:DNA-binding transcriptional LysR family regulator
VRSTEAGEDYLARIEPILGALEEAEHIARGTSELTGRLRVGVATSFATREIIPRIPDFVAEHPKLCVDLVLTDWDLGRIEVNAILPSRQSAKRSARALADFLVTSFRDYDD